LDWDDLKIAHAVARHGSLNAAARPLGTTQPTISRRLDALERRIGAKLFERAASGLSPTALCAGLFEWLNHMEGGAHHYAVIASRASAISKDNYLYFTRHGQRWPSVRALGVRVRAASRHHGPWPKVSVWHGSADPQRYGGFPQQSAARVSERAG